jgi:hypothetical protein
MAFVWNPNVYKPDDHLPIPRASSTQRPIRAELRRLAYSSAFLLAALSITGAYVLGFSRGAASQDPQAVSKGYAAGYQAARQHDLGQCMPYFTNKWIEKHRGGLRLCRGN